MSVSANSNATAPANQNSTFRGPLAITTDSLGRRFFILDSTGDILGGVLVVETLDVKMWLDFADGRAGG